MKLVLHELTTSSVPNLFPVSGDTDNVQFWNFEPPKSGFKFLFLKFLLSFFNNDIISYKITQKKFLLHRHFKGYPTMVVTQLVKSV